MTYRTEIHVAADRYVGLLLPDFVPTGRAMVTVTFPDQVGDPAEEDLEPDDDRQDIEWWDEMDDDFRGH